MYTCIQSTIETSQLAREYLQQISGARDDFWEAHILGAQLYEIQRAGESLGVTAIFGGKNMTLFYLPHSRLREAQPAFAAAVSQLSPRYAYAPTNDELLLSLCMDRQKAVELQAYFFARGGGAVRPPEFGRELLRPAVPSDAAEILDREGVAENIARGKYYVLEQNGVFLGQGFFNPCTLLSATASIGMSVHPDHRQRGVGRSIILHLADLCRERGLTPACGCGYDNHNSKRTLESAGFVTKTRLLKLWLTEKQEEA